MCRYHCISPSIRSATSSSIPHLRCATRPIWGCRRLVARCLLLFLKVIRHLEWSFLDLHAQIPWCMCLRLPRPLKLLNASWQDVLVSGGLSCLGSLGCGGVALSGESAAARRDLSLPTIQSYLSVLVPELSKYSKDNAWFFLFLQLWAPHWWKIQ